MLGECVNGEAVENDSRYVTFWPSSSHPYRIQEPGLQKLKFQVLVQAGSVLVYRKNINFFLDRCYHTSICYPWVFQSITPSS